MVIKKRLQHLLMHIITRDGENSLVALALEAFEDIADNDDDVGALAELDLGTASVQGTEPHS